MFDPNSFNLLELDRIIESYDYESDPVLYELFRPVEATLWGCIENYGAGINNFGIQMANHLRRTSLDVMKFMVEELGFSESAGRNFQAANLFQDLGKIHPDYDPHIWVLPHRPTEEERAEKRKHAARGPEIIESALEGAPQELLDHPHIKTVIPAIQLFHHERVDGSGLFHKKGNEMGLVIKAVCIADAKDGDMIRRGHHDFHRTEAQALFRMKGLPEYDPKGKYVGAFDDLLDTYIAYREKISGHFDPPAKA
ncbi:MAG: hypothetical protein H6853_06040 [Rhodospirillales bacterium]|nr:hypothetical protein [Alphaproteobacteria bacterium]USO03100.1 MAG: hypothetical protein H6853_06040 [Rhodospirillales bacterium]